MADDKNIQLLRNSLLNNAPALFLGAGFSLGANDGKVPSGKNLGIGIINHVLGYAKGTPEYQELCGYPLSQICSFAQGTNQKDDLYDYLKTVFINVEPAPFHYKIANYPWNKIFSTNIDDIVENVYSKLGKQLIVQNHKSSVCCSPKDVTELYKLHGCVHNLEEGLVFDEEEYINSVIDVKDYRFGTLAVEIQKRDFIFVGSAFDDFNIKYYLNLYSSAKSSSIRGRMFFVNPSPTLKLKSDINQVGGVLLEWTTEQFADFLDEIEMNQRIIDKFHSMRVGYVHLREEKKQVTESETFYESNLYLGAHPKWRDIFFDWDIRIAELEKTFLSDIKEFEIAKDNVMIYSVVGAGYSGKSVLSKRFGVILMENGYDTISFKGESFNPYDFRDYILATQSEHYALIVDNGSYNYNQISKLKDIVAESIKVVVVTTSRPFFHGKRKYSLLDCYNKERQLDIKLTDSLCKTIYDKLAEKGYLGELSKLPTERERLGFIKSQHDVSTTLFVLTNGINFRSRFKKDINDVIALANYRDALIKIAIFDSLELPYFPHELLVNIYKGRCTSILSRLDNLIRKGVETARISFKNTFISETIIRCSNSKEIIDNIKELLISISPYVSNTGNSYWNEIQSVLMRDKLLKDRFRGCQNYLKPMLYEIHNYYYGNYNYWLQLGIAEQLDEDYEKALNHFVQAEALGPNSYMVKNAIGRNYIRQAIKEEDIKESRLLFNKGKEILFKLIRDKEEFQVKAYSTHTYVYGFISYYSNKRKENISKREIDEAQTLLKIVLNRNENDENFNKLNNKLIRFLTKRNTGDVKLSLQELNLLKSEDEDEMW